MAGDGRLGLEAQLVEGVGPQVADEDVGGLEQGVEALAGLGLAQVEHDAALAPVVEGERRVGHVDTERHLLTVRGTSAGAFLYRVVVDAERPEHAAHGVAGGRLDLDDLGAPVGHQRGGGRGRHPHAQLDDAQPGERAEALRAGRLVLRPVPLAHEVDTGRDCAARSRSTFFSTLPVALSGSSSTISMARGTL